MRWRTLASVVALAIVVVLSGAGAVVSPSESTRAAPAHPGLHTPAPASRLSGPRFALVSNFETHTLGAWHGVRGSASVVSTPNYTGEPSMRSSATVNHTQLEEANQSFVTGATNLSIRADVDYSTLGVGYVGLYGPSGAVALLGVSGGVVWAGPNLSHLQRIGPAPNSTAQPGGWVDLMASLSSTLSGGTRVWSMNVYVDRTDIIAGANISVPGAGTYSGAMVETTFGTVYYTDLVFTTSQVAITIPGYNNMDGYGQGSGLVVSLLPSFTTLTAQMTLSNWNVPQRGILSFQINAMNLTGTLRSTCRGFFQLGVDLDPGGRIAPWYVPDGNCVAHYFQSHHPTSVGSGFRSPAGTRLQLTISDNRTARSISFEVVDLSITGPNRTSVASIPYSGSLFAGAYTQVEWQPCCSSYPIGSYYLNGTIGGLAVSGASYSGPRLLGAEYMVPYALDTPPSWAMTYYRAAPAEYTQVA